MENLTGIIKTANFILATRDSGYKNLASALAELIDNSIEAKADEIEILFNRNSKDSCLTILDNGIGMDENTLNLALQFGGSTRFNSRSTNGRYGMGLPNGSLSQARRVEVYTWQSRKKILHSYLDLDEIITSTDYSLEKPVKVKPRFLIDRIKSTSGTMIKWLKCDKIKFKKETTLLTELHQELGRLFRKKLWGGKNITINGIKVTPIDPLYMEPNGVLVGAKQYGSTLEYSVKINETTINAETGKIKVKFVELPIEKWYSFSNLEKSRKGITKHAGVSILRAGREIDYGWHFMENKRKENYDDWWRSEIEFEPELDEMFGVTHTKQGVNPSEELKRILSPDIENIARQLNRRVREKFLIIKEATKKNNSEKIAEHYDPTLTQKLRQIKISVSGNKIYKNRLKSEGFRFKVETGSINDFVYFKPELNKRILKIIINEHHNFFSKVYSKLCDKSTFIKSKEVIEIIELMLIAASRAEFEMNLKEQMILQNFRRIWSENLTNYLQ